jgi:hypothetical protein
LQIGRYKLTSAGSKPTFFRSGVTYAALNDDGTGPVVSDLLNSSVQNGARTLNAYFA